MQQTVLRLLLSPLYLLLLLIGVSPRYDFERVTIIGSARCNNLPWNRLAQLCGLLLGHHYASGGGALDRLVQETLGIQVVATALLSRRLLVVGLERRALVGLVAVQGYRTVQLRRADLMNARVALRNAFRHPTLLLHLRLSNLLLPIRRLIRPLPCKLPLRIKTQIAPQVILEPEPIPEMCIPHLLLRHHLLHTRVRRVHLSAHGSPQVVPGNGPHTRRAVMDVVLLAHSATVLHFALLVPDEMRQVTALYLLLVAQVRRASRLLQTLEFTGDCGSGHTCRLVTVQRGGISGQPAAVLMCVLDQRRPVQHAPFSFTVLRQHSLLSRRCLSQPPPVHDSHLLLLLLHNYPFLILVVNLLLRGGRGRRFLLDLVVVVVLAVDVAFARVEVVRGVELQLVSVRVRQRRLVLGALRFLHRVRVLVEHVLPGVQAVHLLLQLLEDLVQVPLHLRLVPAQERLLRVHGLLGTDSGGVGTRGGRRCCKHTVMKTTHYYY